MEVGSKVRVPLTDMDDHRHARIQFALVTPITICSSRSVPPNLSSTAQPFVADVICLVRMSRFVRASKYRQEKLRIHLEAGN